MATNTNQFLVSVADAILRDPVADSVVFKGKTLINSALKQSIQAQEVRGGFASQLVYNFMHSKALDITIESATFDESYVAVNNGTQIVNGLQNVYITDELVTLASGSGTTAQTPVGNVYVQKPDNTIVTITPTGSNFSVPGLTNQQVKVTYRYNTTVNTVTVDAGKFPQALELTLTSRIYVPSGLSEYMQITVPQYQLSGTVDLQFTDKGVSTNKMDGKALVNPSDNSYAYFYFIPVTGSGYSLTGIAVTPGSVNLSATNTTQQLTVIGLQSGLNANVTNPAGTTFSSSATAVATVSNSGLVTRVASGNATITATNGAFTDTVTVTCA